MKRSGSDPGEERKPTPSGPAGRKRHAMHSEFAKFCRHLWSVVFPSTEVPPLTRITSASAEAASIASRIAVAESGT